jgi:hypothetical protein
VHQTLVDKFQAERARGLTIWFGTSHYRTDLADTKDVQLFREAMEQLQSGKDLTEKQARTAAGLRGVQFDARK